MSLLIACDGSCIGNGKADAPIGWAWATERGDWLSVGYFEGTNQRAELHAIWSVLRFFKNVDITVQMDSQYALNVAEKWAKGWAKNGWVKSDKKPVMNLDLVKPIYELMQERTAPVTFQWVKGHRADNKFPLNTAADKYAYEASTRARTLAEAGIRTGQGLYLDSKNRTVMPQEATFLKTLYNIELQ